MKNSAQWLDMFKDENYLKNTVENARRLAAFHAEHSGLKALQDAAGAMGDDPEAVFRLVEATLDLPRIESILGAEKAAFAGTENYASKFQGYSTGTQSAIALARARNFISLAICIDPYLLRIAKRRRDGDSRTVSFSGTPNSLRVLKGTLNARIWTMPPIDDSTDLAALGRVATPCEPITIAAGESVRMSSYETLEYLPGDGGVLILITQMSNGDAPMSLVCDADTGRIRSTQAIGQAPSRLQMLATLLRMHKRMDAWDAIRDLLDHEHHFVRWHALRELIAFDPARALPDALRMRDNDPQPSVRRCAKAAVDMIDAHLTQAQAA